MMSRLDDALLWWFPVSLHGLMARLDRLAGGKEVAQKGREFSFELFRSVFPIAAKRLHGSLQELVAADLIMEQGQPPRTICSFRHALVQDAAYSSLLRDRRRTLHQRVASGSSMLRRDVTRVKLLSRGCWRSPPTTKPSSALRRERLFHSWALLHERDDAAARGRCSARSINSMKLGPGCCFPS